MPKDIDAILVRSMQLATIFEWMETNKLSILSVNFSGENDSGDFDEYISIEYVDYAKNFSTKDYERLQSEMDSYIPTLGAGDGKERSLHKLIMHLARAIQKETDHGVDWWNNEGGSGVVEFIADGVGNDGNTYHHGVCLKVSERIIEYKHYYHNVQGMVEPTEATSE